jgi:hypothetical protein
MMIERNGDWLDRQLREDARGAIDDGEFTQRVLGALPQRSSPRWLKSALILGSTALGGVLAALFAPIGTMVLDGARQLAHFQGFTPAIAMTLAMACVLCVAGWVLAADD